MKATQIMYELQIEASNQMRKAFASCVPALKKIKNYLEKHKHSSHNSALVIGDMDLFCYFQSILVERFTGATALDQIMLEEFGMEVNEKDTYKDFLIFEQDQNLAFAIAWDEFNYENYESLTLKLYCFHLFEEEHQYLKPFKNLFTIADNKYHLHNVFRYEKRSQEDEPSISSSTMNDIGYFVELNMFFLNVENSICKIKEHQN